MTSETAQQLAAFAAGMIDDGDAWVEAGRTRNLLTHSYDAGHVEAALVLVQTRFLPLLQAYLKRRQAR